MGTTRQKSSCRNRLQNGPRLLSRVKAGTHSALREKSHTKAHTPKQGPSPLRSQCGFVLPAKSLLFHRAFIYIHFPVLCGPSLSAEEKKSAKMPPQLCPQPFLIAFFNFAHKWPTFAFTDESEYTLGSLRKIAHSGPHAETGAVSDGGGIITLDTSCTFTNIPGPGIRTANFAALGAWSRVLPKNAKSLRDSDALMRVAVPRRRGPAGLRDLFRFCRNCGLYALRSGPFRVCEARGGITTLSALYVLLKHRIAACQKG